MNNQNQKHPYWLIQIQSALHSLEAVSENSFGKKQRFNEKIIWALSPYIPYVVNKTGITGKFILLNRDYLPVGIYKTTNAKYQDFPFMLIDQSEVNLITDIYELYQGTNVNGRFFNDCSAPWESKENVQILITRYKKLLFKFNGGIQ